MIDIANKLSSIGYIVVLPDFYIDRIVRIDSLSMLFKLMSEKLDLGGSIRGIEQFEIKGGNATNLAYALSKLGVKNVLITAADDYGKGILKHVFKDLNTKLIIKDGKQGYTISIEINNKSNIMISDSGTNANFNFDIIKNDLDVLRDASAIAITNWASNLAGTELIERVFSYTDKALRFLDPADISTRSDEFITMLKRLNHIIDVLSINENEYNILAKRLIRYNEDVSKLAKELGIRIDLHTAKYSLTTDGEELTKVSTFNIKPRLLTGAGDVWDAADLIGYMLKLNDNDRLLFANATAALYISNMLMPSINDVLSFIEAR